MSGPILVVNPNSNRAVTDGLYAALEPFRLGGGPEIECLTLAEGPFGVESQLDADAVILPLVELVRSRPDAGAFVVACYSDPGLDACRSVASAPVLGIQEAGILSALARGDRFGVDPIAIARASIARHRRSMRRMGVSGRLAGERALNVSVDDTARGADTFDRLTEVGAALRGDGADVVILGCAGMARHRGPLESALGLPVVDPTQAAVAMALGAILAGRAPELTARGARRERRGRRAVRARGAGRPDGEKPGSGAPIRPCPGRDAARRTGRGASGPPRRPPSPGERSQIREECSPRGGVGVRRGR